jgi:hypothetical protein
MTLRVTVARRARKPRTAGRHRIKRLPIVQNGKVFAVDLWGLVDSIVEKRVLRVAIENVPGVSAVNDNVILRRAGSGTPPRGFARSPP